eukprot:TRINITY_DN3935_c0_g1_i1.p1 TRINITY_DN3935_c0_g1~~TRINITY_DN3935_c0_g1_i1.p1  ORF type:complete len:410 (+),score=79.72 TRINITY_DN3935_c0_g1_i1:47-1276(+)
MLLVVLCVLLCGYSEGVDIAITRKYNLVKESWDVSWGPLYSHPGGVSFYSTIIGAQNVQRLNTLNQTTGTLLVQDLHINTTFDASRIVTINTDQRMGFLIRLDYSIVLQQLTLSNPPTVLSSVLDFNPIPSLPSMKYLLPSDGEGAWVNCAFANKDDSYGQFIEYITVKGGAWDWKEVSRNVLGGSAYASWELRTEGAAFDNQESRMFLLARNDSQVGLFLFDVDVISKAWVLSSVPPFFLYTNGRPNCENYYVALVQEKKRVLVIYPYYDGSFPVESCDRGVEAKPLIGAVLIDAGSLKVISKVVISSQWIYNLGAISVGDDAVVVWSLPVGLVYYTKFNVFQVVGDDIITGNGFQVEGEPHGVSQWSTPSDAADVNFDSPDSSVWVALGVPHISSNQSSILQIQVTR